MTYRYYNQLRPFVLFYDHFTVCSPVLLVKDIKNKNKNKLYPTKESNDITNPIQNHHE